jgi:hypothetical protein
MYGAHAYSFDHPQNRVFNDIFPFSILLCFLFGDTWICGVFFPIDVAVQPNTLGRNTFRPKLFVLCSYDRAYGYRRSSFITIGMS